MSPEPQVFVDFIGFNTNNNNNTAVTMIPTVKHRHRCFSLAGRKRLHASMDSASFGDLAGHQNPNPKSNPCLNLAPMAFMPKLEPTLIHFSNPIA